MRWQYGRLPGSGCRRCRRGLEAGTDSGRHRSTDGIIDGGTGDNSNGSTDITGNDGTGYNGDGSGGGDNGSSRPCRHGLSW